MSNNKQNEDNKQNQSLTKFVIYISIFLPTISIVAAICLWNYAQPIDFVMFGMMYLSTSLGVTMGFHRYFTHHSFKCKPWLRTTLAILGTMSGQGPLISWTANHRCHHRFSDTEGDMHSPLQPQKTLLGGLKYFWFSHIGWMLPGVDASYRRYAFDLIKDPKILWISQTYFRWLYLGLLIPGVIAGLWTMSIQGALMGILWGGLVRIGCTHQTTWAINSICHLFGKKTYPTKDNSRDNTFFGFLCLGEGWHNSHHAFPTSARHGLKWWQFDFTYVVIKFCEKMGLVWDVKIPDANSKPEA